MATCGAACPQRLCSILSGRERLCLRMHAWLIRGQVRCSDDCARGLWRRALSRDPCVHCLSESDPVVPCAAGQSGFGRRSARERFRCWALDLPPACSRHARSLRLSHAARVQAHVAQSCAHQKVL
eukprot:Amastigsp_a676921_6.p3 type:complete len:125 gc:universal Amastigsp_a676921_6:1249-875(-)